ncbi:class I SAM-dependent methyltransferase [Leisingera sp. McT4-56]|uniref:class I SAM-dependent methyltransferase n=1 Tax=Leisingera sp. McT4-56 TaxID=2881255 RepID=UPI001CF88453|nr:class I SAM-dependent methyltransferase [Leisingera sp. McT4-56]MCB4454843.1 class I SAM-dependent methyltransferase [Leisingera sp. McT4-56]
MSRLDSMLRRLTAQRDGLNWAAEQISTMDGDVLDMGLGNGRTYDHLREVLADRRIWVIDRVLQCHPACVPPEQDFLQGEAQPMLEKLAAEGHRIALAHYDFGFGVKERDVAEAAALSPAIAQVMAPGGIIVSGQPLAGFEELDGPAGIPLGRYMFYRAG